MNTAHFILRPSRPDGDRPGAGGRNNLFTLTNTTPGQELRGFGRSANNRPIFLTGSHLQHFWNRTAGRSSAATFIQFCLTSVNRPCKTSLVHYYLAGASGTK